MKGAHNTLEGKHAIPAHILSNDARQEGKKDALKEEVSRGSEETLVKGTLLLIIFKSGLQNRRKSPGASL